MLFTGLPCQVTLGTVVVVAVGGGAQTVLLSTNWQGSMQPLQEHPRCFCSHSHGNTGLSQPCHHC